MRCGHLDNDGFQCRRKAKARFTYHGDPESTYSTYDGDETHWIVVPFCKEHAKDHKKYNPKDYKRRNHETGLYDQGKRR